MPRRARHYVPGLPYHVVQRSDNRAACFIEPEIYQFYLELREEASKRNGVAVHAYCLMTNHIHILASPDRAPSISETMKVVGSRFAQYINRKYQRTGTLWEGRHRTSLVQSERFFLACSRYIELNPIRAGMVRRPEEYRRSSYGANAWGDSCWFTPHNEYLMLGRDEKERTFAYREIFRHQLNEKDFHLIRKAAYYCQPVGDERVRAQIEEKYGVVLGQMRRGRPRHIKKSEPSTN